MKIQKDHLNKFYEILEKINKKFPLDIDNIKDIIENKLRFHFPPSNNGVAFLAVDAEIRDICIPNIPFAAVTPPPNHISNFVGLLELKIADLRENDFTKNQYYTYSTWLSLLPSGRIIFGMKYTTLDSSGKNLKFNANITRLDDQFLEDHEFIRKLRQEMVQVIESDKESVIDLKKKILQVFTSGFDV